jgi:hypothetical protein
MPLHMHSHPGFNMLYTLSVSWQGVVPVFKYHLGPSNSLQLLASGTCEKGLEQRHSDEALLALIEFVCSSWNTLHFLH